MKKSKEELGRIHKERCKELKQIRAKMAENLGIDLHQRECTYEGYCSGTCPKCKSEEMQINAALLKRQLEEANIKGRVIAAGLTTVAAVSLTGCGLQIDGGMTGPALEGDVVELETVVQEDVIEGGESFRPEEDELEGMPTEEECFLEGDVVYIGTEAEE